MAVRRHMVQPYIFSTFTVYFLFCRVVLLLFFLFLFLFLDAIIIIISLFAILSGFAWGKGILNVIQNCKIKRNIRNRVEHRADERHQRNHLYGDRDRASERLCVCVYRVSKHRIEFILVCCSTIVQACNYLAWLRTQNEVEILNQFLNQSVLFPLHVCGMCICVMIVDTGIQESHAQPQNRRCFLCEPRNAMYIL